MKHAEKIITMIRQLPKYKVYYDEGSEIVTQSERGQYMKVSEVERAIAKFTADEGEHDANEIKN